MNLNHARMLAHRGCSTGAAKNWAAGSNYVMISMTYGEYDALLGLV